MKLNGTTRPKTQFDIALGFIGTFLIMFAYLALVMEWVAHNSALYNGMNFAGGALLLYRVWLDGNYANMLMEIFFIAVAVLGLVRFVL